MGSEQEAEPSSIPCEHIPAFFPLPCGLGSSAMGAFATAWCSMEQESGAGLGWGRRCQSVDSSLRKFNAESTRLQAGRCDFGDETSSITTVNRPFAMTDEIIQWSTTMPYSRMYYP